MISVRNVNELAWLTAKGVRPSGEAKVSGGGGGKTLLYEDDLAQPALAELKELRDEAAKMLGVR